MPIGTWRAEPDSNRLPPAVLAGVLPKALPARIAASSAADCAQSFGHLQGYGSLDGFLRIDLSGPGLDFRPEFRVSHAPASEEICTPSNKPAAIFVHSSNGQFPAALDWLPCFGI